MTSAPPTTAIPVPMKKPGSSSVPPATDPATVEAGEDLLYAARAGDAGELGGALAAGAPPNFADETGRTGARNPVLG
jgi:hypothetical protein